MNNFLPTVYQSLLKREFWEHRNSFVFLPAGLAILLILTMLCGVVAISTFDMEVITETWGTELSATQNEGEGRHIIINFDDGESSIVFRDDEFSSQFDDNMETVNAGLYGIFSLFEIVAWWVVIFYFLGTLYNDRKDKSILFYKSLPVSETQTVLSKLAIGVIILPLLMMLASWVVQLFYVLAAMLFATLTDNNPWEMIWPHLNIGQAFSRQLMLIFAISLWVLPVCAWLMAASAFAKRSPFLTATLPIVGIIAIEAIIFDSDYFAQILINHFPLNDQNFEMINTNGELLSLVRPAEFIIGTAVTAIFISIAIWLRNNKFET